MNPSLLIINQKNTAHYLGTITQDRSETKTQLVAFFGAENRCQYLSYAIHLRLINGQPSLKMTIVQKNDLAKQSN